MRSRSSISQAIEASGTAGPDDIAAAVEASLAQFAPDTGDTADHHGHT